MKPSPPKKPTESLLLEGDAERDAARGAQEGVLLADQRAAELAQIHRQDLARIGRGEGDAPLAAAGVGVDGGEQRLAGDEPLAGAEQLAEQAALLRAEPSPNTVSMPMPASMYIRLPASPMAASPGSSSISTNCISAPLIS